MTSKNSKAPLPLSVAVLMGGESKRFGSSKAFLPFEEKSLAAHILQQSAQYSGEVFAVSRSLDQVPPDARAFFPVVMDLWEEKGPLSGLHSALLHTTQPVLLLRGVDMPFLKREVVEGLLKFWAEADKPLALVPRIIGVWEPLCALWSRELLPLLQNEKGGSFQKWLSSGRFSVREILEKELRQLDPNLDCLKNFNTPAEWKSSFPSDSRPAKF